MERFIHDDFMLQSESARRLFHDYASAMPIMDYHCHLNPGRIASDHRFSERYRGLARRRPLQVARDAGERRGGTPNNG